LQLRREQPQKFHFAHTFLRLGEQPACTVARNFSCFKLVFFKVV
jgi:hypothetical protein